MPRSRLTGATAKERRFTFRSTIVVRAVWDQEAEVFVATSTDVPGLVAEGANFQELQAKLATLFTELLDLNGPHDPDDEEPALEEAAVLLVSEQLRKVRLRAYG